jgi:hypothetical protein
MSILKKKVHPAIFAFFLSISIGFVGGLILGSREVLKTQEISFQISDRILQLHLKTLSLAKKEWASDALEQRISLLCEGRLYAYQIKELARVLSERCTKDVSINLVLRLIEKESNFNPEATGSHGEIGLMQLKPATVHLSIRELRDPVRNVEVGLDHLKELFQISGDRGLALAAFNGGINMSVINYAIDLLKEK